MVTDKSQASVNGSRVNLKPARFMKGLVISAAQTGKERDDDVG
jgi:hypothetical protein